MPQAAEDAHGGRLSAPRFVTPFAVGRIHRGEDAAPRSGLIVGAVPARHAPESIMALDPQLLSVLSFLRRHPDVRASLAAPVGKTVVYSGGMFDPTDSNLDRELTGAWRLLAQAKAQDPVRFDYVTLEERLRLLRITPSGESLLDHANRIAAALKARNLPDQAAILWRALSGIYVQGARGRVRALILPQAGIARSVFALTEVHVLLRADVLRQIEIDPALLRQFRVLVKGGSEPAPLVVM
jgi:hypothetical protein